MNVSYYPGCSLHGTAKEYEDSIQGIAKDLGIKLQELSDWSCCGSSSANAMNSDLGFALPARNLDIAARAALPLVVPCASCFHQLKRADKKLLSGEKVPGITANYTGIPIRYITDFFWEDVGKQKIQEKVKKYLKGLNLVCYYGCVSSRPPGITDSRNPENPEQMDNLMKSIGADVKTWSYKTECCGADLSFSRPDIMLNLTQKLITKAVEANADCIVTACPLCQSNLDMGQKDVIETAGSDTHRLPVFYFTELMALAFGDPSINKCLRMHTVDPRPLLISKGLNPGVK